jgi:exopolysaccharide production protein ExoY
VSDSTIPFFTAESPGGSGAGATTDALERAAGLAILTLAAPLVACSALTVAILSRRSPFVAHLRVGYGGKQFWMWKLRTMWESNDAVAQEQGLVQYIRSEPVNARKNPQDARVCSRFAAFCRRHSIDELPQLLHVVRGEMGLIGPRPLTEGEIARYYHGRAKLLLSVKPGLTGLWQVSGRSTLSWDQRVALDLAMLQRRDWRLYLKIAIRTVVTVVDGAGAW